MTFTFSDIGKAELYAEFTDERSEEIVKMADKGEVELVQETTDRLNEQLVAMASLTIDDNGIPTGGDMLAMEAPESSGNGGQPSATVSQATAATRAPTTVPAPVVVTVTPAPTVTIAAPAPDKTAPLETAETVSIPAPDAALSAPADRHEDDVYDEENGDRERKERLKDLLLRQAIENPEALEKALETAPESLRDILLWAIEVANAGYDEAINNLR